MKGSGLLLAVVGLGLGALGCGPPFKPETLVDRLRVLSIVADPPEVAPGDTTDFSIIELDPSRPGGVTTVLWVGCQPDPFNLGRGPCNDTTSLLQPESFADFPPGVAILGFGPHASYTPDAHLFDVLQPDDPIRQNGTVGQVLAVVIGSFVNPTADNAELKVLFEKIAHQEIQTVLSLTRVTVSEHTPKNQNPHIDALLFDGTPLATDARLAVEPGQVVKLQVQSPAADREAYTLITPDQGVTPFTESLVAAVYSSAGRFDQPRFDLDTMGSTNFTAPGGADAPDDPIPNARAGVLWVVLRDTRGGQANQTVPFYLCDDTLPKPTVTAIHAPSSAGGPITADGSQLSSVLDLVVGGAALKNGSYNASLGSYVGDSPALPSGTYPVSVHGRDCSVVDTGLTVTLP